VWLAAGAAGRIAAAAAEMQDALATAIAVLSLLLLQGSQWTAC
jgi:hypothetical protein